MDAINRPRSIPSASGCAVSSKNWSSSANAKSAKSRSTCSMSPASLDGNPRAVHFKAAGPEKAELVGNVMGSRQAALRCALDTDERGLLATLSQRLDQAAAAGHGIVAAGAGAAGRAQG